MSLENTLTAVAPSVAKRATRTPAQPHRDFPVWLRLVTAAMLVLAVMLGLLDNQPPAVVPASAPATEFSAERAMNDLRVIAARPHPIGSTESAAVRAYLVAQIRSLGLQPRVTEFMGVQENRLASAGKATIAFPTNVVTRIRGTGDSGKAVLVMAHYDTIPISPGASDDGAAIASMLETMRNVLAGPPLKNDVIFLMTDCEEFGQEGATSFLAEDPWAKDAAVVLNFEGRGSSGPSIMFETSDQNGWLVREFAKGSATPITSSLAPQIYQWMPNDTDLTSFKKRGYSGLNFAYGFDYQHYHTALDSLETVDVRSVQHHGAYMSSLTRHFGTIRLDARPEANVVYFTLFGKVIVYAQTAARLLVLIALLLFAGTAYVGIKRRRMTAGGVLQGATALLLSILCAAGAASLLWFGLQAVRHGLLATDENGVHNGYLYITGFMLMAVAMTAGILGYCRRRVGGANLQMGVLLIHLLLAAGSTLWAPGASFLFLWPALAGLVSMAAVGWAGEKWWGRLLALGLHGIVLVFVTSNLALASIWTPMFVVAVPMALTVLTAGFLDEHLQTLRIGKSWIVPSVAAVAGLAVVLGLGLFSGFDPAHPMPTTLVYVHNGDTRNSSWATLDYDIHDWNLPLLADPEHGTKDELLPYLPYHDTPILKETAVAFPVSVPEVKLLADEVAGERRMLRLHVKAQPGAFVVGRVTSDHALLGTQLEGHPFDLASATKGFRIVNIPASGATVQLEVRAGGTPVAVTLGSMVTGLPTGRDKAPVSRPDWTMPGWEWDQSTFATRTFTFPQ